MSHPEFVQGIYEALGRGDMESVLERLHPEIEWVEPEIEGLLYGGTHHGIEAVTNEVLALIPQTWERAELHPETWIDAGNTVVVVGEFSARCKGGDERTWRFAHVWESRDGKGIRVEPFVDTLAASSALGNAG